MSTSSKTQAKVPVFAAVMSPDLAWSEYETRTLRGSTHLPKGKSVDAFVEVPTLDLGLPDARAVRQHEMLHIAFTPDIHPVAMRLAKEGLTSGVALQLAEDMRLAHITERNRLHNKDTYFSQDSVLGLANQLMDSAQAAETAPGGAQSLAVAIVATLGSMYGQPFQAMRDCLGEFMSPTSLDDNIDRLQAAAEAAYGPVGREAIERVFEANEAAVDAVGMLYAHASGAYGGNLPLDMTKEQRTAREQAAFESVYRYAHKVLESLLYSEPPPAPEDVPSTKGAVADNKMASEGIDRAELMMGKSLAASSADYLRRCAKGDAEAKAKAERDLLSFGTPGAAEGDYAEGTMLASVERLDLNMDVSGGVNWAPMTVISPPLERSFKVRVPRRGRPSLDGEIPRHWSRWFADRAILDNRGRRPGGTLLVDVSGSMNWTREETMALINAVPAMTIAVYSSGYDLELKEDGKPYYTDVGYRGRLTILARQGKVVAADYGWRSLHGEDNACDGPALAWLARQPGPRVWFSDGNITIMRGDRTQEAGPTVEAIEDATRIVKLGNITRTTSREDVVRIFSGLSPISQQTSKDCGACLSSRNSRSIFTKIAAKRWGL